MAQCSRCQLQVTPEHADLAVQGSTIQCFKALGTKVLELEQVLVFKKQEGAEQTSPVQQRNASLVQCPRCKLQVTQEHADEATKGAVKQCFSALGNRLLELESNLAQLLQSQNGETTYVQQTN